MADLPALLAVASLPARPSLWAALISRARLGWRLIREPRVPVTRKLVPLLTVAYLLSPVDVIPDAIPFVGELDDAMLLVLGLEVFLRVCPKATVAFHRAAITAGRRFAPMPPGASGPTDGPSPNGPVIDAEYRKE